MHILVAQSGMIDDGAEPRDLNQSPADIVFLSAADTELSLLAAAHASLAANGAQPSLRLANMLQLQHHFSVDLYLEKTLRHARLVIVRLLGGKSYWAYGVEQMAGLARKGAFQLAVLTGDGRPDATLEGLSTLDEVTCRHLNAYLLEGGLDNARSFLAGLAAVLNDQPLPPSARPFLKAGLYWPGEPSAGLDAITQNWRTGNANAAVIFYRALLQSGDLAAVDALVRGLQAESLNPLPIFVTSLRDPVCAETVAALFARAQPDVILNTTAFATAEFMDGGATASLAGSSAPILQVVFSNESEETWQVSTRGLSPSALAMHVALPEVDGRILTRAVSFKADAAFDEATQIHLTRAEPHSGRIGFVARLARAWTVLRRTLLAERKVALILANYPNRDSRIANGVGLDTPQSAVDAMRALDFAGYQCTDIPPNGTALIHRLLEGPANSGERNSNAREHVPLDMYLRAFHALPGSVQEKVTGQWGAPENDPLCTPEGFTIPVLRFGNVAAGIQPARGYNIDPKATYHDPALVPPHNYFAFYIWLREVFGIQAVVHLGKHGNLEWLPGKALALSAGCFPEAALGPVPNIYPFIVNDPGEGSQAKRRTSAVIIDHMTPPLTRAEGYGRLAELEGLMDEYYLAMGVDEARRRYLADDIIALASQLGLDRDCGLPGDAPQERALEEIDNYLCELKEMQIRDGLHVFGTSPGGSQRADLLVALARIPRGDGRGGNASLLRALADDLHLGFDPLDCRMGEVWSGPRHSELAACSDSLWRTTGDTVERLELLAKALVAGETQAPGGWMRTRAVLASIVNDLAPKVDACGPAEMHGLLTALDGRFVPPGPSGAPTRGRPDVLPTGRNFYSVDTRAVPTPAAWALGEKAAELVIQRYLQDHGDWPRAVAMSAWGTANMRTGGDDIAQALALMGMRPQWEPASRRVTGFEVIPLAKLGRPRVDVTFRVSGFFRDAFPTQIDLLDSAVRAVAALDEPEEDNPLAARARREAAALAAEGLPERAAERISTARVFGSKPGAYGAGLQTLIDERLWQTEADFAEAYLTWGQYAYGAGLEGRDERKALEQRLGQTDAILHNQDNREHDILDSDDYYQFEGGLAAAVHAIKGKRVRVYHGDHSRPERPVVRPLEEEIGRVVRGRAANPKWIAGVMRHGYKGAFEIAATVDYLFAFAATTGAAGDHHFEALYDAYLADERVRDFIAESNPHALADIAARFDEAIERGMWTPRSNAARQTLNRLCTDTPKLKGEAKA